VTDARLKLRSLGLFHQKRKYIVRDHLVTVHAEEDLTVLRSLAIPYIDVENNIVVPRKAFELVQANYVVSPSKTQDFRQ